MILGFIFTVVVRDDAVPNTLYTTSIVAIPTPPTIMWASMAFAMALISSKV